MKRNHSRDYTVVGWSEVSLIKYNKKAGQKKIILFFTYVLLIVIVTNILNNFDKLYLILLTLASLIPYMLIFYSIKNYFVIGRLILKGNNITLELDEITIIKVKEIQSITLRYLGYLGQTSLRFLLRSGHMEHDGTQNKISIKCQDGTCYYFDCLIRSHLDLKLLTNNLEQYKSMNIIVKILERKL